MYKEAQMDIKQDVGGRIEDQHAYDLSELNHNHDVRFVPSSKKKGGKKILMLTYQAIGGKTLMWT